MNKEVHPTKVVYAKDGKGGVMELFGEDPVIPDGFQEEPIEQLLSLELFKKNTAEALYAEGDEGIITSVRGIVMQCNEDDYDSLNKGVGVLEILENIPLDEIEAIPFATVIDGKLQPFVRDALNQPHMVTLDELRTITNEVLLGASRLKMKYWAAVDEHAQKLAAL